MIGKMQDGLNRTWVGMHAGAVALFASVTLFRDFDPTAIGLCCRLLTVLVLAAIAALMGVKSAPR